MGGGLSSDKSTKTVVVLGVAYGGAHAAQVLAAGLPSGWRVICIDRNSHANHVYVMPRYAVLPGHEYKAFIPYTNVFLTGAPKPEHIFLHAEVEELRPNSVTLSRSFPELGISTNLAFDYAVRPDLLPRTKIVLVVGGGALGIQFATDIKAIYPEKSVTLLHSRDRLLPRFDEKMHDEIKKACKKLNITLILGERLDLGSVEEHKEKSNKVGKKIVRTVTGREIEADLLMLCTGQAPNTGLLKSMDPALVDSSTGLIRVHKTMQVDAASTRASEQLITNKLANATLGDAAAPEAKKEEAAPAYPHIFAVGDAADAFGVIPAGHNAYAQGNIAARNIIHLIKNSESDDVVEELEDYVPGPPGIKVSLGLTDAVYQLGDNIGLKNDGVPDLQAAAIWPFFGITVEKDDDMRV